MSFSQLLVSSKLTSMYCWLSAGLAQIKMSRAMPLHLRQRSKQEENRKRINESRLSPNCCCYIQVTCLSEGLIITRPPNPEIIPLTHLTCITWGIKTSRDIAVRGRSSFNGSRTYTKDILVIPQDCEATILDVKASTCC